MPSSNSLPVSSEILATDKSKEILDSLFGRDWNLWGTGELGGADGSSANLMLQMFEAFNTVGLVVVAMLSIFVSVVAVVGTAHEGSAMGKKYNTFWMPFRFIMSIAGLAPIFKGLSLFQIAILACIGWSINLGNYVYNIGNDYFLKHTGEFEVNYLADPVGFTDITNGVLKSLTLQSYLKNERGLDITPGSTDNWHYNEAWLSSAGEWEYTFDGDFGEIIIDCPSSKDYAKNLCNEKKGAVAQAIISLQPLAESLANPSISSENIDQQALYKAEKQLSESISQAVSSYINSNQKLKSKLTDYYNATRELGWFSAGSTYWAISWINQETKSLMFSNIDFSFKMDSEEDFIADTYGLKSNNAIIERVNTFISGGYGNKRGVIEYNSIPDKDSDSYIADLLTYTFKDFVEKFGVPYVIDLLQTNDPIMILSDIGNTMINISIGLFGLLVATSVGSFGVLGDLANFGLFSAFIPFFLYGITLAFYLPAIPFIRWVAGLISWIILIVEALIAAPLWIAAHALPEGDGFAGNHARRGYFLLMAIVIRPVLMLAGFFAAIILINTLGIIIGDIFGLFFSVADKKGTGGVIGSISFFIILGITIIISANRIFGLITWLPDHVTNWIGQQLHSLGEDGDVSAAKGAFGGSANIVGSIRQGSPSQKKKPPAGASSSDGGNVEYGTATGSALALSQNALPSSNRLALEESLR